jgi:cation diffusion facilitator family transporter
MVVSAALAALKIVVGLLAGSTAVLADGFESAGDVLASGLVFVGLTVAAKPADLNHPYGHGRAETLSGFLLGILLSCGGLAIGWQAVAGVGDVQHPPATYAIWPLLISIVVKAGMVSLKLKEGRRSGSSALVADAWNDAIDMLSAAVAISAVGLTLIDPVRFLRADHYGAGVIGIIMAITGFRVVRSTGTQLMDTMPDEKVMAQLRAQAMAVSGVLGVEKLFARKTGLQYHVDIHIEVNPEITVSASHEIARGVRERLRNNLKWVYDTLVHVEPAPTVGYSPSMETGTLPNVTRAMEETKVVPDPAGVLRFYFEGRTDLLSSMTAGSLLLNAGMSPHPPHQHPEEEFMVVTEGTGLIMVDGKTTEVGPGSMMYCAGNTIHGVENTGKVPLLFYFYKWLV